MNQGKSVRSIVTAAVLVLCGALAACVGDEPAPVGGDDGDGGASSSGSSGASSGSSGSSSGSSGSSGGSSGSSGASSGSSGTSGTSGDGGSDAAVDSGPDAPPPVTCSEQALLSGAFNFRCRASQPAYTPGGTIQTGDYLLTDYYGCSGGVTYQIGSAKVFEENGLTYLRFTRTARVATGDVGTKYTGTYRLTAGGAGVIDTLEECDPVTKGTTRNGHYAQTAGTPTKLVLDFTGEQLTFTKQ